MAELRSVDPRTLRPNPNNPRRTPAPAAMDEQLVASIKAIGIIQPPVVREMDGDLVVKAGDRRVKAAIDAEFPVIDVIVSDSDDAAVPMQSLSENLIRASMNSVDIWRATEALEAQGWNDQAIADALALPVRTIKRLKLLAHLHPAMLDFMAGGSMPSEDQLRTITAASRDEQAQVWKKHKPKRGQDVHWHEIARALSKRRMPFTAAKFGDDLAKAYGVEWHDDLFAPAGEDGRYTTDVEGFFGAQQEWLANNLPERGTLLPTDEYGRVQLPKKAEYVYGKPGKGDVVGYHLDPHSGEVRSTAYRLPTPKKPAKAADRSDSEATCDQAEAPTRTRPDVTQKGCAMIGDLRTDALHQALQEAEIDDDSLLALLILAFAGRNVSVQSGASIDKFDREAIADSLTEGGVLTVDPATLRTAARSMLTAVLSCRDNMTNSGMVARIAGDAIGATLYMPNMATEAFLSCLSKAALERVAAAEDVRVGARAKDTRAQMVERFKNGSYVYPGAVFKPSDADLANAKTERSSRNVAGTESEADDAEIDREGPDVDGQSNDETDGNELEAPHPVGMSQPDHSSALSVAAE
jgi:ParB family transcriptional regulator, chromosome partitioning protein